MCEKPLILAHPHNYLEIEAIANETKSYYYTAYNHRFEPGILKIREVVSSGQLGEIYYLSMYYGNGTAQAVRESVWRDSGMGVLSDLGSHLIDTSLFLLSHPKLNFETTYTATFENNAPDFAVVEFKGNPYIRFQVSLCSWKNTFRCELIGSLGSVMMEGLVKWGPSKVELNKRSFPTDIPITTEMVYKNSDLSWNLEYDDFKTKCNNFTSVSLENDMYIQHILYSKNRKI
jgi:predicted dehydrogenase